MNNKEEDVEVREDEKTEPRWSEFPLVCPNCGRTFYQDYDETERTGVIICPYCKSRYA